MRGRVGCRRKREVAMLQMPRGIKQTTVSEHAHSESDTPFAFGRVAEIRFDNEGGRVRHESSKKRRINRSRP